jgi:hypothetical protein
MVHGPDVEAVARKHVHQRVLALAGHREVVARARRIGRSVDHEQHGTRRRAEPLAQEVERDVALLGPVFAAPDPGRRRRGRGVRLCPRGGGHETGSEARPHPEARGHDHVTPRDRAILVGHRVLLARRACSAAAVDVWLNLADTGLCGSLGADTSRGHSAWLHPDGGSMQDSDAANRSRTPRWRARGLWRYDLGRQGRRFRATWTFARKNFATVRTGGEIPRNASKFTGFQLRVDRTILWTFMCTTGAQVVN